MASDGGAFSSLSRPTFIGIWRQCCPPWGGEQASALAGDGDETVVAADSAANKAWETARWSRRGDDWAAATHMRAMDTDGFPEVVPS